MIESLIVKSLKIPSTQTKEKEKILKENNFEEDIKGA